MILVALLVVLFLGVGLAELEDDRRGEVAFELDDVVVAAGFGVRTGVSPVFRTGSRLGAGVNDRGVLRVVCPEVIEVLRFVLLGSAFTDELRGASRFDSGARRRGALR